MKGFHLLHQTSSFPRFILARRDVGVAGSNPVTPTTDFITFLILDGGCFCHLVPGQKLFGPRFGPNFLMRGELHRLTPLGTPAGIVAGTHTPNRYGASSD
jgi:hypothetical protein